MRKTKNRNIRNVSSENGITWAPLLLGYVRFGKPNKRLLPLYKTELLVRGINISLHSNLTITKAISLLKEWEYPDCNKKDLSDFEKEKYKFFYSKVLTALDWHEDNIEDTLRKYYPQDH